MVSFLLDLRLKFKKTDDFVCRNNFLLCFKIPLRRVRYV